MRKRTLFLFASLFVFLIGILVMPAELTFAKDQTKKQSKISAKSERDNLASLRALYQDKTRFQMLSSAGQIALERRLGIRSSAVRSQRIPQKNKERNVPNGGPANVLVNDPSQDATAQDTQSETTIALSGPNIVAGFNDSGSFLGGEPHFTGVSYSSDGGATFTDIGQLPDSGEGDAGDPALARDNTSGRLYLTTLGFNTFSVLQIFRSDDNGVTWQVPVSCCFQGGAFQDKEWVAVDNAAGAGQGNVYIAWRSFGDGIYFVRSTDQGDTWSSPIKIADQGAFNVQGAFVMTGPSHEVYVAYLDNQSDGSNNFIKIAKSTDQGQTFGPAVTIAQLMTFGVNGDLGLNGGFRSNAFPHAVVNPANGHIYVTWNDDVSGADDADVFYSASTDGGATWSPATNISDLFDAGTNDDWQPTIAITPSGAQAFVGWYDRENDPSNSLIDWYGAIATVGSGVLNFLPQVRISSQNFPVVIGQDPVINPVYMGDYDTAVADNGFLHTVWGDNRDPNNFHTNQPDVRYAKLVLGPTGTLQGFVTDSGTTNPIQGATVDVTPGGGTTTTDSNGFYSIIVPIGTYDVTASAFGYLPATVNGVVITDGGTTTQDFALDQAPQSTVTGTVFDNSGHGWGLYARIDIDGYPNGPVFTNPANGVYSVDLPQGTTFTFHVSSNGYFPQQRDVLPGQNPTEDFGLDVDGGNCNAPGYGFSTSTPLFTDDFEGGFGNWTADGLWNPENESDTCGSFVAPFPSPTNDAYFGDDSTCTFDVGIATGSLTTNNAINVPSSGKATLTFWSYEQTECGGECFYDNRYVEVSTNGGGTWTTLADLGNENTWYQKSIDLGAYSGQSILLRFRFDSIDDIGNGFFGWMVDSVDASVTNCEAIPGGLIVGNVYDLNTGLGLNGAKVTSVDEPNDQATTFATPEDPNTDDGLYVLFSSLTGTHDFTASKNQYGSQTQSVDVAAEDIVVQNFQLGTGHLVATPPELEATVDLGTQLTQQLTITNDGNADGTFEIQEANGLVSFKVKGLAPKLPKAKVHKADKKATAKSGPTSVMSMKNAPKSKQKGLFPGKDPNGGGWTGASNIPFGIIRYGHAQCDEAPESFYIISGVDSGFGLSSAVARYDADTDTWTPLANYPNPSEAPTAVCFQGRIYVANGAFSGNELFIYDIATDTWLQGASLPRFVEGGAMGAIDGKVYLIGGDDDFFPGSGVSNEVDIYDIATDTWTGTGSPMPDGVANAGFAQSGPFVYIAGGWDIASPGSNSNFTQRYDMSSDTWEVGPTFDLAASDNALSATDTALYSMGGDQNGGGFFEAISNVQRLDLSSWPGGGWADFVDNLPSARQANSAGFCTTAVTGGEIWSDGGFANFNTPLSENIYHNTGEGCAGAGIDVPWISENPATATVPANGGVVVVDVTYDAAQVQQPGDYFAHLTIKTDTPYPAQKVNVTMHVPLPASFGILQGTVTGLGQCDTPGGTLEGATVFIDGQIDDFTVTTDANGFYTWALDEANSPVTLTVSANKYNQEVRPGVTIIAQQTTTEDFQLRLDAACLSVNPTAVEEDVPFGGQATDQFTITNDGASDANFELTEANGLSIVKIRQHRPGAGAPLRTIKGNFSPLSKVAIAKANGGKLPQESGNQRGPQDAPWTDIANYPTAIMDSAATELDGLVYNAAGIDGGLNFLNTLFAYDPGTDTWTQLASMSAQRERPAVAAVDGLIYVTNGWDSSGQPISMLEIYDPASDTWSTGAPNPAPMGGGSDGISFEGKFYVIGGCSSSNCGFTDVQVYDPSSDTWSSAADYPEPISWQACGVANGQIYCAGGTAGSSTTANAYAYDPGSDSWTSIASMPQDQWAMGYVASDDKLYISGGVTAGFSTITNQGFVYDPNSDTWTAIENSNNTVYRGAGACGFYRIGGSIGGFSPIPNSEVYPGLTNCGGSVDVPWLSENPFEGTIPADGGQVVIDVNYDAAQILQPGDYFAHINVKGNSPGATPKVDVTMHVAVPPNFGLLEGTVTGLGQCDTAGGPINKATVFIDGPMADYTVETDATGHYQWYFDAANSPVDVTVSAAGYIGVTQTGIVMNPGQTTTADFQLRLDAPCLSVDQTSLDQTLPLGGLATQQVTISNTGAGDANYKFHESGGAAAKRLIPKLPKAISQADKKRLAMSGPASVRSLKNAPAAKLKGLFPKTTPNAWIPGASNPNPVIRYAHAQCDDTPESFYVISGVDTGFGLSSAMSRYDADTDTWTSLAAYPSPSEAPTGVCFEQKIYVANGAFTSNEFFVYDIATDSWSSAAALPRFVEGAAMGALDGKIYLIGGDDDFFPGSGVSNEVDIYDIATNTWTGTGASMPTATANAGYVQAGTYVYVVGGWGLSAPGANSDQTQRYDMSSDTWEVGPTFSVAVSDFALAGSDTALYAMGGDSNGGGFFEPSSTAQRLDLSTWPAGTWSDLGDPLTFPRQANQAGFCTSSFTGGEVWTTDAYTGFSVDGINEYRTTGEGCATGGGDVPWLSENPSEGVVPAGGSVVVDVTFDASQVAAEGDYFAQLKISGNAPGASPTIDVAMHVISACTYSQDFNDNTREWLEEKPAVTQPGDGFLHLDPVKKKAIGVADSSFAGATTGVFNFDIQFTGGPDAKNWIYTHRVDKKNQMEVLFKVEQGKVVVKDRGPGGVEAKAKADFALAPNTPYSVSIAYNGTAYAVVINGTTVISGFSPVGALPNANIGAAAKNNSMLLDNVCVNTP